MVGMKSWIHVCIELGLGYERIRNVRRDASGSNFMQIFMQIFSCRFSTQMTSINLKELRSQGTS